MGFGKFLFGGVCAIGAVIAAPVVLPTAMIAGGTLATTVVGAATTVGAVATGAAATVGTAATAVGTAVSTVAATAGTAAVAAAPTVAAGAVTAAGVAAGSQAIKSVKNQAYHEGKQAGYKQASEEYEIKIRTLVARFKAEKEKILEQVRQSASAKDKLIEELLQYIEELEHGSCSVNMSNDEKKLLIYELNSMKNEIAAA